MTFKLNWIIAIRVHKILWWFYYGQKFSIVGNTGLWTIFYWTIDINIIDTKSKLFIHLGYHSLSRKSTCMWLFNIVHGIWVKLVSNREQHLLYTKSQQLFKKNDILTGLKVSSLTCEWVFYRPEHNVNEGPYGTELWRFWNAQMKYTNGYSSKSRWITELRFMRYWG